MPRSAKTIEGFLERLATGTPEQRALFDSMLVNTVTFDPSILEIPPDEDAPVPVAYIIDTANAEQPDAFPSATTSQGMAEYSNANFFSRDTIFNFLTYPRQEDLGESYTEDCCIYYPTGPSQPVSIPHIVSQFETGEFLLDDVDRKVYLDYASRLLPRAAGYSMGVLDYFFRGDTITDLIPGFAKVLGRLPIISFGVRNLTPDEQAGAGQMVAILRSTGTFTPVFYGVSDPIPVSLADTFQEFTFSGFSGLPADRPLRGGILLVYIGQLGAETEAVMLGRDPCNDIEIDEDDVVQFKSCVR